MAERPDYYALLGVERGASPQAVRSAYKRLAAAHHPDRQPDDEAATGRFQSVVEAYGVLGDEARRSAYDKGQGLDEIPIERGSALAELIGTVVDGLFGIKERRAERGRNRQYRLEVSFEEAGLGFARTLTLPAEAVCERCEGRGFPLEHLPSFCPRCSGHGAIQRRRGLRSERAACPDCVGRGYRIEVGCPDCEERGVTSTEQMVSIDVSHGVSDGETLRIRGAGEPGRHGGEAGDCHVLVEAGKHPMLRRAGLDVELERPVPLFVACTGGRVAIPSLEGIQHLRLPAGTEQGAVLRMKGFGARGQDGQRGDQLVSIQVEMPTALDEEARSALSRVMETIDAETFPSCRRFEEALGAEGGDEKGS